MKFSEQFLEELRTKNDIESVIAPYVNLRRSGRLLMGLCPFHGEKTPSFAVYPDSQSFYCFGCGKGGDVVTFVRLIENLSYPDAVRTLADRSGIRMPDEKKDDGLDRLKKRCLEANRLAAIFYSKQLLTPAGKKGLDYLLNRGLTEKTIKHFGLGFAPDSWNSLTDYLKSKGFRDDELVQFNLSRKSKNGRCYDAFKNRIMFPIINLQGSVIAFGGRVMDDSKPKYLNSSDTVVFKKGLGIFALNFAKNSSERKLILCEGYMDVISLHQCGFTNAVAGLGTALKKEQALLLSRYADEVYICYDSDEAGMKAARRAIEIFDGTSVKIKVLHITGGKDPDEVLKKHGPEKMRAIISGSMNDTEFKLSEAKENLDLSTENGKLTYANSASKILAELKNDIEVDLYASKIAEECAVPKDSVTAQIKKNRRLKNKNREKEKFEAVVRQTTGYTKNTFYPNGTPRVVINAEEQLLSSLLRNTDFFSAVKQNITAEDFTSPVNRIIFNCIEECIASVQQPTVHFFNEYLSAEEMGHLSMLFAKSNMLGNTKQECIDCVKVIKDNKKSVSSSDVSGLSDDDFLKLFNK